MGSEMCIRDSYRIISVEPVNGANSSLVLEDIKTTQIHFVRVEPSQTKNRLKFVQLGVLVNSSSLSPSRLIKYNYIIKTDGKTDKNYHIGIVARENGRFEVYADYILVNEYYNPTLQCVDIKTDFNKFFLKFVNNAHLVTRNTPMD